MKNHEIVNKSTSVFSYNMDNEVSEELPGGHYADSLTEEEKIRIYGTKEERERIGAKIAELLKGRHKTRIPYDPIAKCYTKPPEWDDDMWEAFVLG
jgi:hypothetical protein